MLLIVIAGLLIGVFVDNIVTFMLGVFVGFFLFFVAWLSARRDPDRKDSSV